MISRLSGGGGVAYEGMLIRSFRPSNSLAGEGILSLMRVARIDSIAKYGSIPVFRALSSVFFTVLIPCSSISFDIGYPADLVTCSTPHVHTNR